MSSAWGRIGAASFAPPRPAAWAAPSRCALASWETKRKTRKPPTMAARETVAETACFSRPSWRAMRTLKKKAPAHKTGASQA